MLLLELVRAGVHVKYGQVCECSSSICTVNGDTPRRPAQLTALPLC